MIDVTNYTNDELTALFMMIFNDTTTALTEDEKIIAAPIFKTGVGLDTESTTISHTDEKGNFVVDHCFCYTYQVAYGTEHYAIYRNVNELLNSFDILIDTIKYLNMYSETPAKVLIWVANLSHELSFIKYKIMHHMECKKMFAKTARDALYVDFSEIEFRECIGLFGRSLDDIAKNWTTTQKLKGDLDYSLIRTEITPLTEQEKQYCINDVIILTEMHENVLNAYTQDNGSLVLPYTSSGFVRLKLKNAIRDDNEITEERNAYNFKVPDKKKKKTNISYLKMKNRYLFVDTAQWLICREYGYSGGLCGSNIRYVGKVLKNVQCADLTSDYPAQMLHESFPYGNLKERPLSDYTYIKDRKKPYFVLAIAEFDSNSDHATFSKHKCLNFKNPVFIDNYGAIKEMIVYNGKILHAKNCIVCLNDVDINAYSMIYKLKLTILKLWSFDKYEKLPPWISNTIIDDYTKKAVLKHQGLSNTQEYKDAKRNVNSFYGVFAQRPSDAYDMFNEDEGLFENSKTKSFSEMRCDTWLNPYIAFWVTSYARRILMYFISKYPDEIVQYDTDSLYYLPCEQLEKELQAYNKNIERKNMKLFKNHNDRELLMDLGCWDFDEIYEQFLPMGAKKYIKQHGDTIETVIAGLPKSAIPKEIKTNNIKRPLDHYNVVRYVTEECMKPEIIIKHMFAGKFASVYNDSDIDYYADITDYLGNTHKQLCGCYHALAPIDFTLSMGVDYLKQILKINKREC